MFTIQLFLQKYDKVTGKSGNLGPVHLGCLLSQFEANEGHEFGSKPFGDTFAS